MDGTLMLETLYYPDEIRVERGVELPEVQVSDRELEMASTLIDLLADAFEPEKYEDEYRQALMAIIEAKLQGEEFVEAPAAAPAKVTDLMAALKASVEAAKKRRGQEAEEGEEAPRRRRRAAAG
jgi:DNA end-binding protein Ku